MDCFAIFVDAGYVLADCTPSWSGELDVLRRMGSVEPCAKASVKHSTSRQPRKIHRRNLLPPLSNCDQHLRNASEGALTSSPRLKPGDSR